MVRRTPDLPPDIIETILLILPVKSLLRFKSVSKSWNSIISDPLFARNHYHQNPEPHNLFLRRRSHSDDGLALVKLENGKLQTIKTIENPLIDIPRVGDRLCFSEYGMLLVTNNLFFDTCILWNPCTRKSTQIPLPYDKCTSCSGICYDPAFDDFKVVVVHGPFYAVYSCKNKSWSNRKRHPHDVSFFQPLYKSSGVSVNGAIYWLLGGIESRCEEIIYYDTRDNDNLKILPKPKDVPSDLSCWYLLDLGGHLCLYCYYGDGRDKIQIWRKGKGIDNNSWKELITIHINVDRTIRSLHPLCFVGDKIVIQYTNDDGDKLVVYDPLEKTFEECEEKPIGIGSLIPYRETVFLT